MPDIAENLNGTVPGRALRTANHDHNTCMTLQSTAAGYTWLVQSLGSLSSQELRHCHNVTKPGAEGDICNMLSGGEVWCDRQIFAVVWCPRQQHIVSNNNGALPEQPTLLQDKEVLQIALAHMVNQDIINCADSTLTQLLHIKTPAVTDGMVMALQSALSMSGPESACMTLPYALTAA